MNKNYFLSIIHYDSYNLTSKLINSVIIVVGDTYLVLHVYTYKWRSGYANTKARQSCESNKGASLIIESRCTKINININD